jgi:hypothetical protein
MELQETELLKKKLSRMVQKAGMVSTAATAFLDASKNFADEILNFPQGHLSLGYASDRGVHLMLARVGDVLRELEKQVCWLLD